MNEEQLNEAKVSNKNIYGIVKAEGSLDEVKKNLTAFFESEISKIPEAERPSKMEIETSIKQQVDGIATPWLRYFLSYDPKVNLKKLKCPVLVLNGEKDIQVTSKLNTEAIVNALKEGGNKNVKLQIFPGLNHLFQHCTTCNVAEYGQLDETFSPEVLKTMSDWILQKVK